MKVDGVMKDYIKIEYAGDSTLYVLATQLDVLQKYAGADAKPPKLNRLDGQDWKKTKIRVRGAVKNIAKELVELYAAREHQQGFKYGPDTVWQREFEEMFPFEETEDQLAAIEAAKKDMESGKIMDRLVCGDVDTARRRLPSGWHSRRCRRGNRWFTWCPPPFWPSSTTTPFPSG